MTMTADDLGVLGNLGVALGLFEPGGSPNIGWFESPEDSLGSIISNDGQRNALLAFVDEALGGAEREIDAAGAVWLPIIELGDSGLTLSVTIAETTPGIDIGLGLEVRTNAPDSLTTLMVPLFRAKRDGGPNVANPLLLGSPGGRIRIATSITVDDGPPVPGAARLGSIGLDVDIPTSPADADDPVFGLSLTGFQLPGATSPRDLRVSADGADELDDALLDLVFSLLRSTAETAAPGSIVRAIGGLLGLLPTDDVSDFPIDELPSQGVHALAAWMHGIITSAAARADWIGHLSDFLGGTAAGETIAFDLGGDAQLTIGIRVGTGPSGNVLLTPTLGVELGADDARIEARVDLLQIDLVTGAALALPQLGVWAAMGKAGDRVLDVAGPPVARADTLRVGFALDAGRHLTFVLAADGVQLGSHNYPTLDLTSPDAVMDAVGNTVADVAAELLGELGDALAVASTLLGLTPPAGVNAISLADLLTDPLDAVAGYWRNLVTGPAAAAAVPAVLGELRDAVADATSAIATVKGTGTPTDPWRVELVGPLGLEAWVEGDVLSVGIAASTSVDTLGARCTVVEVRLAATIATIDLAARSASLLPGVHGVLSTRERGVDPPRVTLALPGALGGISVTASGVGLRLGWTPGDGLAASIHAPNLQLNTPELTLPIALPTIAPDGSVTLPAEAWDGIEALVGYLGDLLGGTLRDVVHALSWTTAALEAGGDDVAGARLRLADLVADPASAIGPWLAELAFSELGPRALDFVADLFGGAGAIRGTIIGTGHPDDPYRFALDDAMPNVAVWFPPAGLEPRAVSGAPGALQRWRPGDPGLPTPALAVALAAEAEVATDVRQLVESRDIAGGLNALRTRWTGGDGRIAPPPSPPDGVTVVRDGVAAGQLLAQADIEDLTGRIPTTTVHVALGADAWPDAPAGRRVDLTAPGLAPEMFVVLGPATGDWFVTLGTRAACRGVGSASDGTPEQAARLARVLDAIATVSTDIAVVALVGAGHAARVAAEAQAAVTDLVTLGTPLSPISLTALSTQPTADALRLLARLLPTTSSLSGPEDEDLALGRALVGSMIELTSLADPSADLRPPIEPPPTPRAGLAVTAVFGAVDASQVGRAVTAIVAAGLAERARTRATTPLPDPTGVQAGLRLVVAPSATGTLAVSGDALLTLFAYDRTTGVDTSPSLRVRMQLADRTSWLVATPDLELRKVTADVLMALDGADTGTATVTLHDARVFGQTWERLVLGIDAAGGAVPVLPEARTLLAAAIQRLSADSGAAMSNGLGDLLAALGIVAEAGGVVGDAVDQLVHDPGGLLRQRFAAQRVAIAAAVAELLGPVATVVDLDARTVHVVAGSPDAGRYGWHADVTFSPGRLAGQVRIGKDEGAEPAGGLGVTLDLDTGSSTPLTAQLRWYRAGSVTEEIALWPHPDPAAIARAVAASAPSLGGQVALELLRGADEAARPIVDAALDALGLLDGAVGAVEAHVRPVAGLLADPAGWLRSTGSLASEPARIQSLFDALRPLLGVAGAPGSPLPLANGVTLTVGAAGAGARLQLVVDPSGWVTPPGVTGRFAAGVTATLDVGPTGPPAVALGAHIGLSGATSGRQAVHVALGSGAATVFVRPTTGADIPLVPFAGLGSLAAAAQAALPFLLDQLAAINGDVGDLVGTVGDALALRLGAPAKFDGGRLHAWAVDPIGSLTLAANTIQNGFPGAAPLLDALLPNGVAVTATANELTVTIGDVSVSWNPDTGIVRLVGDGVAVPGVDVVSFTLALGAAGLEEVSVVVGPASIVAGGVTLQPYVLVAAGDNPAGGRRIAVGLAIDDDHRFAARWLLDSSEFALVASSGAITSVVESTDPVDVALSIVEVIADLVASVALAEQPVQDLLDLAVGAGGTVRDLLEGVVLADGNTTTLIDDLFALDTLLARAQQLFQNIAAAGIEIVLDEFTLTFLEISQTVGVQVGLTDRFTLLEGDIALWLENDDSWIEPDPSGDGGIFVGLVSAAPLSFTPTLVVNGLGLRIGSSNGPLLDTGIALDSVALHVFAEIDASGPRSGGVQIQLSNLAVSTGGAQGDNAVAQGIMRDTGPQPPQPAFSPSLAVQKHGNGPVAFTLRAGEADGPWWIAIQKGFGPLYLEQIGFDTEMPNGRLTSISLLMDGSVSMFGLTCAVDDLSITYFVENGDFFNAANWSIDLAGLAVSADMAGLSIAGGLLKQTSDAGIEYLGMLLARFGVYGITIFGGYGEGVDNGEKFTAFFAVGAINGPIGGPPAFFLTGIGGGFGINRALVVPTDLSDFGSYPLIQALDIAAEPTDPMAQLRSLGTYFPMEKGTFWFAAGLSFTSFALVDGIAVVAVEVGDGLDINLLGLARMALPRPQVALVSIEVALLVRFSSSEGVLWVQGQLTDNSWLLYPEIKLTGGFAYVIWFKGEHAGEFVLTLGGYHPDFHRDGYPVVPRLGIQWSIGSNIVIEAGSYFALTSEALMAGGDFHASAEFGPAWAEVKFGAHGIVYFDPFRYQVDAYARISAGVTIDTWLFGEITISISIGARISVTGPDFHGKATFDVGPIELTVEFGGDDQSQINYLSGSSFVDKYLDPADDGSGARAHTGMTAFGALPSKGEDATPDGSSLRPFIVVVEFGLTFTSTVPMTRVKLTSAPVAISDVGYTPSKALGVAPMGPQTFAPVLQLTWLRGGAPQPFPFVPGARPFGAFPPGVWGPPQDMDNRKVPKAEMIEALSELDLLAVAVESPGGPEIPYYQVEIGKRKPLPFSRRTIDINALKNGSAALAGLVAEPASVAGAFTAARTFLTLTASPTALASLRGERQSPPRLGTLGEGLDIDALTVVPDIGQRPPDKVYDHFVDAPRAVGLLSGASVDLRTSLPARTTVKDSARAWRTAPPTMAAVEESRSRSIAARLVVRDVEAVSTRKPSGQGRGAGTTAGTVIGAVDVPPTAVAHAPSAVVERAGGSGSEQLASFATAMAGSRRPRAAAAAAAPSAGATLQPGQTVVLKLPNAAADVADGERPTVGVVGAPARVVLLAQGGGVLRDQLVGAETITVDQGTERIVTVGQGTSDGPPLEAGLAGWYAGMQLPYVGWTTAIAPGCVVRSLGEPLRQHGERLEAGWIDGAELARGVSTVTTRFAEPVTTVVVIIDDPTAFGDQVAGRQLLLGLDGAERPTDGAGVARPPVVLAMENRSVLAYDVVPEADRPVIVTIASQLGWSLVGVMGSVLSAQGAVALISSRGLDAAVRPFAPGATGVSRLRWQGEKRTDRQREKAKALASGRPGVRLAASGLPPTNRARRTARGRR
ncbi:MAG: DUF6603 domain-containing protein [Ilumatobacteraceae bacterium]